ncbi:MAG: glycosyltransferase family 4 protein [Acidobacteria bacterium]|mgnify:CR=1 FL=1|nr:glycosyltransferase family 4 protein [Acidobacteriota bacterium]HNU02166.1 glycosyltransferase family 1 protein [Acidobacteriota bacterium]
MSNPPNNFRVAINVDELFGRIPGGGGQGRFITQLLAHLAAIDPHTRYTLFSARRGRELPEPIASLPENFRLVQLPTGPRGEWLHFVWHTSRWPILERWLGPQHVVHATSTAVVPAVRSARLVVTVHDMVWWRFHQGLKWAGRFVHRTGLRIAAKEAGAVAAVSEATRRDVLEYLGPSIDPARLTVIPNAAADEFGEIIPVDVRLDVRARYGLPNRYVVAIGTVEPRKNLHRLIAAYSSLPSGLQLTVGLVIIGPYGWKMEALRKQLRDSQTTGRIIWTGHIPDADLRAILAEADLFAYPSLMEGFGIPILEAMLAGVPVVTSNTSSMPEVAGDAALLVDPTNTHTLRTALERALTDEDLRRCLIRAGLVRARQFSFAATAEAYLSLYRQVAGAC